MMAAGTKWQKNMADVRAQIEDLRGLKRGHVDIAVIDALAKGYIPAAIRALAEGREVDANEDVAERLAALQAFVTLEGDFGDAQGRRVFSLTRSSFAGQQRTGATLWSGDITSSWDMLRRQVAATGMHAST